MRFTRADKRDRLLLLEITPMIDVVFLLVIFFMTAAQFASDTRADLDLPLELGEQKEEGEEAGLVINLTADGAIEVAGAPMTLVDLEEEIRGRISTLPGRDPGRMRLLLRADRNCDAGRLNEIIEMLRRLGVATARLATEVPR